MSKEFQDDTRDKDVANAVAATWVVSFEQIRKHDAVAADLMEFMSCIECKAIPRPLLPSAPSEERTEEAISVLSGCSFLTSRERNGEEKERYDMHRLVHLAMRIWTSEHGIITKSTEKALEHITYVFLLNDDMNQAVWKAYLPHALRVLQSPQSHGLAIKADLSLLVGRCLIVDGRIREALHWLEGCCQWKRDKLKEDDPDRLLSEYVLAVAYRANGQVKESITLLEQIVKLEEVLEEDHLQPIPAAGCSPVCGKPIISFSNSRSSRKIGFPPTGEQPDARRGCSSTTVRQQKSPPP